MSESIERCEHGFIPFQYTYQYEGERLLARTLAALICLSCDEVKFIPVDTQMRLLNGLRTAKAATS